MTTTAQKIQALNEYDAWMEAQVLIGVDTSIEAYEGHLEHEENGRIVQGVREILNDRLELQLAVRLAQIALLFTDQKEVSA